jgi:two-component system, OmpR family, sensor kinase
MNDIKERRSTPARQLVVAAFSIIVGGVVVVTLSTLIQVQALQSNARDIVENMLASVRLVGQLAISVERRRILVGDHIFASKPDELAGIEAELARVDEQIAATTRAYDPWAILPNERATWDRARVDLAALDAPIARALALSRQNRDSEARQEMERVREQFAGVGRDFDQLIAINDQAATKALSRFSMIRFRLMLTLLGMGVAALVGILLVGRRVSRQVARREAETLGERQTLEARNRELDAFAGRVAHDVRGPLTSISLAAEQLAAKLPNEKRPTETLQRGLRRIETLVDDLLALARVEALSRGRCDPAAVVAQIEEDFGARIAAEQGTLRVVVGHAEVSCSEGLLRQAVGNLVENAVKYCRPGVAPKVEISGEPAADGYDLRVSDNGVGMSQEDANRAFEPFYRSPQMQALPGSGLGLSIVNRVAQANGGALTVRTSLGHGSTFVVHLPLAAAGHAGEPG